MARTTPRPAARRGLLTRFASILLGAGLALGLVLSMQLPLMHHRASVRVTLGALLGPGAPAIPLAWPGIGSAALDIPALHVVQVWHDRILPIASLTKMMTTYVALAHLPLTFGQTGPCHYVTPYDLAQYQYEQRVGQSSVPVAVGERLCEIDLLNGLLVRSGGNYALMLASIVAGTPTNFVAMMNAEAVALGLHSTHYDDVSGFSTLSVSNALDQARLASLIMRSALVRAIVRQPSVTLPVAGTVASYTPFVGVGHVVGVKSGRTDAAGGCDVMAMAFSQGGYTRLAYAVVLGQRGGNLLGPAGNAAFALDSSALANRVVETFARGEEVGRIGWAARTVPFGFANGTQVTWWALHDRRPFVLRMRRLSGTIKMGEVVGWLHLTGTTRALALVAQRRVSPPTIWQRLL